MSRAQKFLAVLSAVTFLPACALIASSAPPVYADDPPCPGSGTAVVVGQNDSTFDVGAVQAAVNGNRSVVLTGTFDFGVAGRVVLNCDVDITGEADTSGAPLTTIRSGEWNFFTPYPSFKTPLPAGPRVSIQHLHFVAARGTAVHLAYSGGASLRANVIDDMRARYIGAVGERAAIVVGPALLGGAPNNTFFPGLVSGDIQIADNTIDVSGPESPLTTRGTGMFVSMYVGADVRIERNLVTGNTRTGLAILDGTFDSAGRGSVVIAGNVVRSDVRFGFIPPGPRAPIGIVTGFNNQRVFGSDPNLTMIPVLIENNTIEMGDPTPGAAASSSPMGIINIWNGAVIRGNKITVHGHTGYACPGALRLCTSGGFLATASHQVLLHNEVSGEGCNAIRFGGTVDGQERKDNVAIGNNITQFQEFTSDFENCADVWLEPNAHDNTVVGNSGSVIDDGTNNQVTGLAPAKGGVGAAVSEGQQDAQEVAALAYD